MTPVTTHVPTLTPAAERLTHLPQASPPESPTRAGSRPAAAWPALSRQPVTSPQPPASLVTYLPGAKPAAGTGTATAYRCSVSQERRTGQSPPWWPAVAARGPAASCEPAFACLRATTAWAARSKSDETVQSRHPGVGGPPGLAEGGRGSATQPTVLKTSDWEAARLPRGLTRLHPGTRPQGHQGQQVRRSPRRQKGALGRGVQAGGPAGSTAWAARPQQAPGPCPR